MGPFINQFKASLVNENSSDRRKEWAKYILEHNISLSSLKEIIFEKGKLAMRFSWLISDVVDQNPDWLRPELAWFFNQRNAIENPNFNRSLAKWFLIAGIPDEIEGEAVDALLEWLMDPQTGRTCRYYSMIALSELTQKHPDLKGELKLAIEHQIPLNSRAFGKKAQGILESM